jgi:hypothetical protein
MTIASQHPINEAGLAQALEVLRRDQADPAYYFVVPSTIFDTFAKQLVTVPKGKKRSRLDLDLVRQFVVKVDV